MYIFFLNIIIDSLDTCFIAREYYVNWGELQLYIFTDISQMA